MWLALTAHESKMTDHKHHVCFCITLQRTLASAQAHGVHLLSHEIFVVKNWKIFLFIMPGQ